MGHYDSCYEQEAKQELKKELDILKKEFDKIIKKKDIGMARDVLWFIDNYKGFEHFKSMVKDIYKRSLTI